ncbi:MAG TPA: M81 family metallopeptidase [Bryobacteraceae bacterium]|nr:M81 family metallopeptidase [Bryobacteraceae bacterium]
MRIAVGGIQTECSTYSRIRTKSKDFKVLRGREILDDEYFSFLGGFRQAFETTFFARAVPGGPIDRQSYEQFKGEYLRRLAEAGKLDGVYLAMHGAMFVEGMQDAEGDWITATREVVGDECLISASYDLHGNVSRRIVDTVNMLTAYRTAPHIDVEETMQKGVAMLVSCLEKNVRPAMAWLPVPVLMPGERSSTVDEPAKSLYAQLPISERREGVMDASLLVGYVWADEPRATASVVLTGTEREVLSEEALRIGRAYWAARGEFQFGVKTGTLGECIRWAEQATTAPVILADSGDNPTGGGVGDRAEAFGELLRRDFKNVLIAGIADAPATHACYEVGTRGKSRLQVGGTLDPQGSLPVACEAEVLFTLKDVPPRERQAVIRVNDIQVVLTAARRPFHNLTDFSRLGLDPRQVKLLVVKSGYLSPDLAPIANPNLMALSDGAINQDIEGLPANEFRVPTFPFDKSFEWKPDVVFSARQST